MWPSSRGGAGEGLESVERPGPGAGSGAAGVARLPVAASSPAPTVPPAAAAGPPATTVWDCLVAAGVDLEDARTALDTYLTGPATAGPGDPARPVLAALQDAAHAAAHRPAGHGAHPAPDSAPDGPHGAVILPLRRRRPVVGEAS